MTIVLLDQNPESTRAANSPVAPARRARASSDERERTTLVFACLLCIRVCNNLAGAGTRFEQRSMSQLLRVAAADALLVLAVDLTDRGIDIDHHG